MRKTISVKRIVEIVNSLNSGSTCSPRVREGWNSLAEDILRETGTYNGFGYLSPSDVPAGEKPGCILRAIVDGGSVFPDETRRRYYLKS